jgi:hypothetical protein
VHGGKVPLMAADNNHQGSYYVVIARKADDLPPLISALSSLT